MFLIIALILAMLGPSIGIGGAGVAMQIAKILIVLLIVLVIIELIFGSGFSGGIGHSFTI